MIPIQRAHGISKNKCKIKNGIYDVYPMREVKFSVVKTDMCMYKCEGHEEGETGNMPYSVEIAFELRFATWGVDLWYGLFTECS